MISYNASISACEKKGLWQLSLALLTEALQSHLQVTTISFSAAIGACERAQRAVKENNAETRAATTPLTDALATATFTAVNQIP